MPNKRTILNTKKKSLFAGREKELALFRISIAGKRDFELLHVTGIGGIGKTALLDAFGAICEQKRVSYAIANVGDQELPLQLVRFIYEKFKELNYDVLPNLETQVSRYEKLDQKIRVDKRIPEELKSAILIGGNYSKQPGELDAGKAMAHLSKILGSVDADFYINPTPIFTDALVSDLAALKDSGTVCLIFDRYERISPFLDDWIRQELFPRLEENTFVITASRQPLPEKWQEWMPLVRLMELEPLALDETRSLVKNKGIEDHKLVEEITDFAGGLPLAASMAADLLRETGISYFGFEQISGNQAIVGILIQRLTAEVSPELRGLLEQCSIVRWFNEDTLEQYVGVPPEKASEAFSQLCRLSFVQTHPKGVALHDLVREFINNDLSRRSNQRYIDLNNKAADYYEKSITQSRKRGEQQPLQVELVYHLIRADEDRGIKWMQLLFDNATDFSQFDFSAALLETSREVEIDGENRLWLQYFEAVFWQQKNVDNLKSARMLELLISNPEMDKYPELKARIAAYLSIAAWYVGEHKTALKYAKLGLDLSNQFNLLRSRNRALESLGLTYNRLGKFQEGIETQLELLKFTRLSQDQMGEAWTLNNLGYFSWHAGKWTDAEDYLLKCKNLMTDLGSPYNVVYPLGHLGLLYAAVGRHKDADTFLSDSLKICKEEKNLEMEIKSLQNFADLRRLQCNYNDALQYVEESLRLSKEMGAPYFVGASLRRRGEIYTDLQDFEKAHTDFIDSLKLAKKLDVIYPTMRILVHLESLRLKGWIGKVPSETQLTRNMCKKMGYHHLLSDLEFNHFASFLGANNLDLAVESGFYSLLYGMLYNRYWLYNQLGKLLDMIDNYSQGEEFIRMLSVKWSEQVYLGTSIQAYEKDARTSEPGLTATRPYVLSQLQLALTSRH